ncbi:hypothetical protein LPJ61_002786, partial [Coemansia biformis]
AQPLLSESAIRSRYVGSPNEFARSLLDRCSSSEYVTPQSLAWGPGRSLHNATENVIDVVATDSSGSSDSGMDSEADVYAASQEPMRSATPELEFSPHSPQRTGSRLAEALGVGMHAVRLPAGACAGDDANASLAAPTGTVAAPPAASRLNWRAKAFVSGARAMSSVAPSAVSGDAAAAAAASPIARSSTVAKRRCRFWPTCSNGRCKYAHPQKKCRMYPNCSFGNNCIFVHQSDVPRIHAFIAGNGTRRTKRRNDIIKFNHLESYNLL